MKPRLTLVLPVLLLTACATGPRQGSPSLAGTSWQLVAIQSMDDAQGTTKLADPTRFTLTFGTDGRASLRLDCNRGSGTWEVKGAGAESGQLTFGPLAATRAMCPPPHLDERIARDLPYVRSYLLKNGHLFLSLMADGGIYEWAPLKAGE
ncbi:MAG: META domain-containing protein [Zoogloeaceae bacterium]|nr:META domain-containing protein [Zoogloeaceae bacterium]